MEMERRGAIFFSPGFSQEEQLPIHSTYPLQQLNPSLCRLMLPVYWSMSCPYSCPSIVVVMSCRWFWRVIYLAIEDISPCFLVWRLSSNEALYGTRQDHEKEKYISNPLRNNHKEYVACLQTSLMHCKTLGVGTPLPLCFVTREDHCV